jgi:hypothetical protein
MNDPVRQPTTQVVELWQEPSRLWRWRYLEPSADGQPLSFLSNKEYETREAALRSATTAYPGVAVIDRDAAGPGRGRRGPWRRRLLLLVLLVLVVLALRPRRPRPPPDPTSAGS